MSGLSNKDKENIAFDLYMNTDKTQAEICAIVDWAPKTFTKKKQEGMWDELKGATQITAHRIISNLYKRLAEETETDKKLDADKIVKIAKSIEFLSDRKTTVSQAINLFKEFTSRLMETTPELAKKVIEHQNDFINFKINGN
jgi:hypothetical protein